MVDEYKDEIGFLVDYNQVHIQVVRLGLAWVKPLPYEVNIDETRDIIEAIKNELVDPKATYFRTYEEAKIGISIEIQIL